jgi:hypothetical protein
LRRHAARFQRVRVPPGKAPEHPGADPRSRERSLRPERGVESLSFATGSGAAGRNEQ